MLYVCMDINKAGTNCNHCTDTCNLACPDLVINPNQKSTS